MSTDAANPPPNANVSIESVLGVQQHTLWQRVLGAQSFQFSFQVFVGHNMNRISPFLGRALRQPRLRTSYARTIPWRIA